MQNFYGKEKCFNQGDLIKSRLFVFKCANSKTIKCRLLWQAAFIKLLTQPEVAYG